MNRFAVILSLCFLSVISFAQNKKTFTKADTLRGSINTNRNWWNVLQYVIDVTPDYTNKTISGKVTIHFAIDYSLYQNQPMQIDLQSPLTIDSVLYFNPLLPDLLKTNNVTVTSELYKALKPQNYLHLPFKKDLVYYIDFRKKSNHFKENTIIDSITVFYHGKPIEAIKPPWDGGWIFKQDEQQRPWMSVAVQGLGASAWYPCKDHQSDEPDSGAILTINVPDTLTAIANGRLMHTQKNQNTISFTWQVKNPINNYNIVPYIGKYISHTDTLHGENGVLDISYYYLDYNAEKAMKQFQQVKPMLRSMEYWFGAYPFYTDGYKIIEAPHLGMEHQSAIAYGNKYQNGYAGRDLSSTGNGMKFDFIIVHESGHEWFANNITAKDIADMWIHESFTSFSEVLFLDYYYGKKAGNDYCVGVRKLIQNKQPLISSYGVNDAPDIDIYYKGENILQTIRHAVNNDDTFRQMLRSLNKVFYHQTVTTQQVEQHISKQLGFDYSAVFNQYLRTTQIPQLELYIKDQRLYFKWSNCVNDFNLPLHISLASHQYHLKPLTNWQSVQINKELDINELKDYLQNQYYIQVFVQHPTNN